MGIFNWLLDLDVIQKQLDRMELMLINILKKEIKLMQQFDDLSAAVATETTVIDSAIVLINGLIAEVATLKDAPTPEAVQAVLDKVVASRDALAAAVEANTPVA